MDNNSPNGMNQRHTCITQQSNGVGVRFLYVDDGLGSFIRGITPDFNNFGTPKTSFSTYIGINCTLLNAWDKQTIYNPTEDVYRWGL